MNPINIIVETTQAIAANPNDAVAYKRRAVVLCQMQQWAEAQKDLDTLIDTLGIEDAEVYQLRGAIRMRFNNKKSALEDFKHAILLDPSLIDKLDGEYVGRGQD